MTAPARRVIEPQTGRAEKRAAGRPASTLVGKQSGHEIGAIRPQSLPGFLTSFVEDAVKWRLGDNLAASAAPVARLDDGQAALVGGYYGGSRYERRESHPYRARGCCLMRQLQSYRVSILES
jgi:hypothetical protein